MVRAATSLVSAAFAHVFAADAETPPLRLSQVKILKCTKAHVCRDLPYGGRQVSENREIHYNTSRLIASNITSFLGKDSR